jgi:hypothetical protein
MRRPCRWCGRIWRVLRPNSAQGEQQHHCGDGIYRPNRESIRRYFLLLPPSANVCRVTRAVMRIPSGATPILTICWCRRRESNPRPRDYETLALPLSYAGLTQFLMLRSRCQKCQGQALSRISLPRRFPSCFSSTSIHCVVLREPGSCVRGLSAKLTHGSRRLNYISSLLTAYI